MLELRGTKAWNTLNPSIGNILSCDACEVNVILSSTYVMQCETDVMQSETNVVIGERDVVSSGIEVEPRTFL